MKGPQQVVIVGHGMAGARLAEEIRRRDAAADRVAVTVIGAEAHPAYNRVLLSAVVGGSLPTDAVRLHDPEWADRSRVDLRLGTAASGVDRAGRLLHVANGSTVDFDTLVLATGSRTRVPQTEGLLADDGSLAPGVVSFRTLDDCEQILAHAGPGTPVAVLGGGLLGLEAARGMAGRGSLVTVVHPVGHLMERQLDPAAGRTLARMLAALGIEFRLGVQPARYLPGDGLKLDDGSLVPADLVVVTAGARPETAIADAAGLHVAGGIVVDDLLRTNDPRIYAIGDCAAHPRAVPGFVQPAWEQAAVLADLLTGTDPAARYRGTPAITRLKVPGVDLTTLGDTQVDEDTEDAEVVCVRDPVRGRYAKLVIREDLVAGAILLGVPDAAATIAQLFDRRVPPPSDRLALLLGQALPTWRPGRR